MNRARPRQPGALYRTVAPIWLGLFGHAPSFHDGYILAEWPPPYRLSECCADPYGWSAGELEVSADLHRKPNLHSHGIPCHRYLCLPYRPASRKIVGQFRLSSRSLCSASVGVRIAGITTFTCSLTERRDGRGARCPFKALARKLSSFHKSGLRGMVTMTFVP